MKKNLLLMMICVPVLLFAEGNGVKVSNLTVNTGSPSTVTFEVSWQSAGMPTPWSDTVWVWVDYNDAGVMKRLPVTSATATAGTVTKISGNDKGVLVVGNARSAGNFSATVKLFTATPDIAGACAYASNYPPVGEYSSDAPILSFTGTPMYDIQLTYSGGGSATVKSGGAFLLPCNYTPTSFTDATGAPGRLIGTPFNDNGSVPRYAASAKTWPVGNQIWSDVINVPACATATFTNSTTDPYCRSYTVDGKIWYYYNWPYVNANKDRLCPSPWRVPSQQDFVTLDKAFVGGTGENRSSINQTWIKDNYITAWGSTYGVGFASGNAVGSTALNTYYWTSTPSGNSAYSIFFGTNGYLSPQHVWNGSVGFLVRCVK
jgi:uncharacterized protein (TIGR02145 family)